MFDDPAGGTEEGTGQAVQQVTTWRGLTKELLAKRRLDIVCAETMSVGGALGYPKRGNSGRKMEPNSLALCCLHF